MNLLNNTLILPENNISNFRKYQYDLIPYFIKHCFEYLRHFGLEYEDSDFRIEYEKPEYYFYLRNTEYKLLRVMIKEQKFLEIAIPILLEDNFFMINGHYYIPIIYCVDGPITLKNESVILYSLFKPITIYYNKKENRIIFNRRNFAISTFLRLFFSVNEVKYICNKLEVSYTNETFDEILDKFSKMLGFSTKQSKELIKDYVEKLFLDSHTKEFYEEFYNINDVTLEKILKVTLLQVINKNTQFFIDLKTKHLTITEILLQPIFLSIGITVNKLLQDKIVDKIYLKHGRMTIKKHFQLALHSKNSYDIYTPYTAFLDKKTTYNKKTQEVEGRNYKSGLPSEISGIHETYFGKICPISTSNKSVGESFQLVPDLELKNLKFGIFNHE